jgi:hypothetical protein
VTEFSFLLPKKKPKKKKQMTPDLFYFSHTKIKEEFFFLITMIFFLYYVIIITLTCDSFKLNSFKHKSLLPHQLKNHQPKAFNVLDASSFYIKSPTKDFNHFQTNKLWKKLCDGNHHRFFKMYKALYDQ